MLKTVTEKVENMQEQMGNFNRDGNYKKDLSENSKNEKQQKVLDWLISRFNTAKVRSSELKIGQYKLTKLKHKKKKSEKIHKQEMWDNIKWSKSCIIGTPIMKGKKRTKKNRINI